jgi:hypothetical protein
VWTWWATGAALRTPRLRRRGTPQHNVQWWYIEEWEFDCAQQFTLNVKEDLCATPNSLFAILVYAYTRYSKYSIYMCMLWLPAATIAHHVRPGPP